MLADPRAKSLSDDFAFQWLHIAKLDEITPDRAQFPHASGLLDPRALLKEELRLFLDSVLRSDRSVFDLLTADYTFLNERLAMHYGIETVKGAHFRRVTLDDPARHGLLGKGADPDDDGVSQPHVAGAARRLDPGPPARHAAGRSAARRAVAAGEPARPAGARRCAPGSSSTARTRPASPATA